MRFPSIAFTASTAFFLFAMAVRAGIEDVTFPVAQLGNCESQEACFAYCEEPANYDACIAFAQEKQLLNEEQIDVYERTSEALAQGGPGDCASQGECEAYCSDINNINECIAFAEANGIMGEEELAEAKKVQTAINAGYSMPGGCSGEASCETYCSDPTHMQECLTFAEAAGFVSGEELAQAKRMMELMQSGSMPGGCTSKETCEAYCEDPANGEECMAFAVESGMMTQEEAKQVREGGMMRGIEGPGGCASQEACEAYCSEEANREECQAFAQERGFESEEGEREMMEEFVGPGGCATKDECEAFCSQEGNRETCEAFFGGQMIEERSEFEYEGEEEFGEKQEFEFESDEKMEIEGEWKGDEYKSEYFKEFGDVEREWKEPWEEGIESEGSEWEAGQQEWGEKYDYEYDYDEAQKYEEYRSGSEGEIEGFYPEGFSVKEGGAYGGEGSDYYEVSPPSFDGGSEYGGGEDYGGGSYDSRGDYGGGGNYGGSDADSGSGWGDTSGGGWDSSDGGGGSEGGAPQSLGPAIDAGFVESIKRFFYRANLKARGVLTL